MAVVSRPVNSRADSKVNKVDGSRAGSDRVNSSKEGSRLSSKVGRASNMASSNKAGSKVSNGRVGGQSSKALIRVVSRVNGKAGNRVGRPSS